MVSPSESVIAVVTRVVNVAGIDIARRFRRSEAFLMSPELEIGRGHLLSRDSQETICPLCAASEVSHFHQDRRDFRQCAVCRLVFVRPEQFLSPSQERAHYDLHENSPADAGYRRFLSRLFVPMCDGLSTASCGLDFGSGPGPTLSVMFEEAGYTMAIYDPCYAPDRHLFQQQYDFITASEVVEHLHRPQQELDRLWSCLKPGGRLGVMTKRVIDREAFSTWHYKHDPTHVCFFSVPTFEWLADRWDATLVVADHDVVLFHKAHDFTLPR